MSRKPIIRTVGVVSVLLGALGTAGCATRTARYAPLFNEPLEGAALRVENHSFKAAHVYLIWNNTLRIPLGPVEPMDSRTWTLPPRRIADGPGLRNASFRLEARFHPTRDVFTSPVRLLADGREWSWQLENIMAFSTLVVRRTRG
jgi:hypothetical protein